MWKCFFFHSWAKWKTRFKTTRVDDKGSGCGNRAQYRECARCGKREERDLNGHYV